MKKKTKIILAVCFVLVCGVVYVGSYGIAQRKEQIVLEKQVGTGYSETEKDAEDVEGTAPELDIHSGLTEMLYVHICGAVEEEGVYTLPGGSRLIDGVTAAGGFTDAADTAYHNLAAVLIDGQKVYVPTKEETEELSVRERMETVEDGTDGANDETDKKDDADTRVNINTAGKEELMTLSGIGESKAESILLYRKKVGAFQSIEELKHVSGIGDAMYERIKDDIVTE